MAETIRELIDRAAIEDVLVRYATGLDRRDFALVRTCFADDVCAEYSGVVLDPGVEPVMAHIEVLRDYVSSLHLLGNMQIEVAGDAATSVCRAVAYLVALDEGAEARLFMRALRYDDRLARTELSGWRITHRRHVPEWSVDVPVELLGGAPSAPAEPSM